MFDKRSALLIKPKLIECLQIMYGAGKLITYSNHIPAFIWKAKLIFISKVNKCPPWLGGH